MPATLRYCCLTLQRQVMKQDSALETDVTTQVGLVVKEMNCET